MRNTKNEIKNSLETFNSKLDNTEVICVNRISYLEDRIVETILIEQKIGKIIFFFKKKRIVSHLRGNIKHTNLKYRSPRRRRERKG